MRPAYYNEFDPFAAAWLRELIKEGLIADGDVDERSICDVQPSDLEGYTQCHFFAGIGGWSTALRLAGWGDDRSVWTGSCPCQPFSSAGKRQGNADERHLWPEFFRLVKARRPQTVFGEQVASSDVVGTELEAAFVDAVSRGDCAKANKLAKQLVRSAGFRAEPRWLDGIFADLEGINYTCRANDLPAACVGAPHIRQRLYWVADCHDARQRTDSRTVRAQGRDDTSGGGAVGRVADAGSQQGGERHDAEMQWGRTPDAEQAGMGDNASGLVQSSVSRLEGHAGHGDDGNQPGRLGAEPGGHTAATGDGGFWSDFRVVQCRDGKARHVPAETEPGFQRLVDGLPDHLAAVWRDCGGTLYPLTDAKTPGRVGLLRGFGNAIVPAVAAAFITAFCEAVSE